MSAIRPLSAADVVRDLPALRARLAAAPEAARLTRVDLADVRLGPGVLRTLGDAVLDARSGDGDVVLLADVRPMEGDAGTEVKGNVTELLAREGMTVRRVTVGDAAALAHADAATIDAAAEACRGASVIVSVGSGTVVDIGKAVTARLDTVMHVVVQTASSVNGFADDQSVLLVDGVKRTTATRWPDRLIIDTEIIARAPAELNRAGLGDLLATYTAPADWLLARLVGQDDSYSPAVVALARQYVDPVLDHAAGVDAGDQAALDELSAALTLSGISMGAAGRTAPGSGMEHTVSHLLEMAERPGETGPLHGAKVGVLTVLAAMVWARVRAAAGAGRLETLRFPSADEMEPRVRDAFAALDPSGAMGAECWRDYARKLQRWNAARATLADLPAAWPAFDAEAGRLLATPERLIGALQAAKAPVRLGDLGVEADTARWALANGHLMRDRFTVADLAFFMGIWDDAAVDALLADAAALGAGL